MKSRSGICQDTTKNSRRVLMALTVGPRSTNQRHHVWQRSQTPEPITRSQSRKITVSQGKRSTRITRNTTSSKSSMSKISMSARAENEAADWKATFDALVAKTYDGTKQKIDRTAMAAYRQMRTDVARATAELPWPTAEVTVSKPERDVHFLTNDVISLASFLEAPLAVSFHHLDGHHPDGDLGNECLRRCKFDGTKLLLSPGATATNRLTPKIIDAVVMREPESHGYRRLTASCSCFPLSILPLLAPKRGRNKSPSLAVPQARKAAAKTLQNALGSACKSDLVVLNGLPFCKSAEELHLAAQVLLDVLGSTGKRVVLCGRHAQTAVEALRSMQQQRAPAPQRRKGAGSETFAPCFFAPTLANWTEFERWWQRK